MSFFNVGVLPIYRFESLGWLPPDFTTDWILFYSKMIQTSMILSNLMPYAGVLIKIAIRRCCCCCKRKNYKPKTYLNPYFPIERRYASLLTTVFVCCTYGISMPALFVIAAVILIIQTIVDRLLITYFYRERVEHNDLLNRTALTIMKYALFSLCLVGGLALASNYNSIANVFTPLAYSNQVKLVFKLYGAP